MCAGLTQTETLIVMQTESSLTPRQSILTCMKKHLPEVRAHTHLFSVSIRWNNSESTGKQTHTHTTALTHTCANTVVGLPPAHHDDNTLCWTAGPGHSDNLGFTHPTNLLLSDSDYKRGRREIAGEAYSCFPAAIYTFIKTASRPGLRASSAPRFVGCFFFLFFLSPNLLSLIF